MKPGACVGLTLAIVAAFAGTAMPALAQAPLECSISGRWPFILRMAASDSTDIIRADLFWPQNRMLGRQLIFRSKGEVQAPIISSELNYLVGEAQPIARCELDTTTSLKMAVVVDVGPQVTIHSAFQGKGSLTVSFFAYEENYFDSRSDDGLVNQIFVVQLDDRAPYEAQVSAKPGENIAVRFDAVSAGKHRVRFGEMDPAGDGYATTWLWFLDFVQPSELSA